jgi:hypothetical protein
MARTGQLQQPGAGGVGRRGGARRLAQLGPYVRDVAMHGVLAEDEPGRDLGIAQPLADEPQDLELARRENRRRARIARQLREGGASRLRVARLAGLPRQRRPRRAAS